VDEFDENNNIPELTISELSGVIKRTMEDAFGRVRLRGEVSGFRGPHSSGHSYFTLKDENARIDAVIWRGVYQMLDVKPEEGLEVIATGKVTTYPGRSVYQIVIDHLEPAGIGALMALLEERRRKLAAEGLFDEGRKQVLPYLPQVIGVVTSPTGSVIRDILHRISDRFAAHVLVWPVRVQGDTSASEVAAAIRGFDMLDGSGGLPRPDVLIIARGGGSIEDLWGFNQEEVVRAVAACTIPVISAVGHETDWTLIDHVADRRAPTPTAAAEFSVPVCGDLALTLGDIGIRLMRALRRLLSDRRVKLDSAIRALPRCDGLLGTQRQAVDRLGEALVRWRLTTLQVQRERLTTVTLSLSLTPFQQRIDRERMRLLELEKRSLVSARRHRTEWGAGLNRLVPRMRRAEGRLVKECHIRVDNLAKMLLSLGYENVLGRGYAIVRDRHDCLVRDTNAALGASEAIIQFSDGRVDAVISAEMRGGDKARILGGVGKSKNQKGRRKGQGSLF
jgi:exodeoxyribonuclease VII large subunit